MQLSLAAQPPFYEHAVSRKWLTTTMRVYVYVYTGDGKQNPPIGPTKGINEEIAYVFWCFARDNEL